MKIVLVAVVATLTLPATAKAHLITRPHADTVKATAASQEKNLAHARYVARHGEGFNEWWHEKAQKWLGRELRETKAKMRPSISLGSLSCISCWDRVASCESGGRWNLNTGNGFLGGLQWLLSTWLGYGGGRYAPTPLSATRMEQISIASHMNLGHWPVCGARY